MSKKTKGVLGVIGIIATLIFGWIGLGIFLPEIGDWPHLPDRIYKVVKIAMGNDPMAMSMEPDNVPWQLIITKVLVVIILSTTFIKLFQKLFYEQYIQLRLMLFRNHTLVCGLNEQGSLILQDLKRSKSQKGVGIESTENNVTDISTLRKEGHAILIGDVTEKAMLLDAGVRRANTLICSAENEQTGVEVLSSLHEIFKKKKMQRPLHCYLHVAHLRLINAIERSDQFKKDRKMGLDLHFFNYDKMIVRSFFGEFAHKHASDMQAIRHGRYFRLVIFGYNQLTKAMMVQAMRVLHFSGDAKTEVIVIDYQAPHKQLLFEEEYPFARQIFSLRFIDYNGLYKNVLNEYVLTGSSVIPVVIFAFETDEENIRLGLETMDHTPACDFRIYSRNSDAKNIGSLLSTSGKESRLRFFGDRETFCRIEYITGEKLDATAKTIHHNYLEKQPQTVASESEAYKTAWDDLSEDARDANRAQADHIPYKLAELGIGMHNKEKLLRLPPEEIERLAIAEHERWSANRILNGWQFGKQRNDLLKLHPSLIPWKELSETEKQKDRDTILQLHELMQ